MKELSYFALVASYQEERKGQVWDELLQDLSKYFSGIFFVLPCIESYQRVDLRTITLGVPPQEVRQASFILLFYKLHFLPSFIFVSSMLYKISLFTVCGQNL